MFLDNVIGIFFSPSRRRSGAFFSPPPRRRNCGEKKPRICIILFLVLSHLFRVAFVAAIVQNADPGSTTSREPASATGASASGPSTSTASSLSSSASAAGAVCTADTYWPYVPPFFDCEGSPSWQKFFDELTYSAEFQFAEISKSLYDMASEIVRIHDAKPYPPQDFHNLLCDPGDRWGSSLAAEASQGQPYQPFCLYGFIYALFVRARVFMAEGTYDRVVVSRERAGFRFRSIIGFRSICAVRNVRFRRNKIFLHIAAYVPTTRLL